MKYVVIIDSVDYPSRERSFDCMNRLFSSREKALDKVVGLCVKTCSALNALHEYNADTESWENPFCEDMSEAPFRWTTDCEDYDARINFWDGDDYERVTGFTIKALLEGYEGE